MSPMRVLTLFFRDLARGPRSPVFLYALVMPVIIVLVTRVILIALIDPEPRLGLVDLGHSEVAAGMEHQEGIALSRVDSVEALHRQVEQHDFDAGLVLKDGFDDAVRAGEKPSLDLWFSGESRMVQRVVLAATVWDEIRVVEGRDTPVEVTTAIAGDASLPIKDLVVLGILLWPLLVCSTLVPGMLLVQEKESRTLAALLVTPTKMPEVLLAKAALGFSMAMVMCLVTLALAGALTAEPVTLLVVLAVSIVMCCEIGLIYGTVARDEKTLYNIAQTMNIFILAPLLFYFFPAIPQWPAKLFPTYWFIDPLYRIGMQGALLSEVAADLAVAVLFVAILAVPVVLLGRRMKARVAAA
jgi:ABC-2 type transport system permease protein